jgi:hypothetical protein
MCFSWVSSLLFAFRTHNTVIHCVSSSLPPAPLFGIAD